MSQLILADAKRISASEFADLVFGPRESEAERKARLEAEWERGIRLSRKRRRLRMAVLFIPNERNPRNVVE